MTKFATLLDIKPLVEGDPCSIIPELKDFSEHVSNNPEIEHRSVALSSFSCLGKKGYSRRRVEEIILPIENNQFILQDLPDNNQENPHWDFNNQDLQGFIFSGDAYAYSFFYGANLEGADLSQMTVNKIYFDDNTNLKNTKFPRNILDKGILGDERSKLQVIKQLAKTYRECGGAPIHCRFSFFSSNVKQVIEQYKARSSDNPDGASSQMLQAHGFNFS